MKTTIKISTLLIIFSAMFLWTSCSKDRIEDPEEKQIQTDYASLDDFYDLNELPEQEFVIDSTGGDTIIGMDSTIIWGVPKEIFMIKSTQQDISYPYTLKLIEAYSIKNMILSRLPGLAQGDVLKSAGNVKITAFKNADELALKNNCGLNFWSPSQNPVSNMDIFYGFTNGTTNDFNNDVLLTDYLFAADNVTSVNIYSSGYHSLTAKLGWMNVGQKLTPGGLTTITFTATGNNTNYIDVYVVFNDRHNFVKVSNLSAPNMPVGENITVFAIAKDASAVMYYFKEDYVITSGLNVDLNMITSTEAQVLSMMDAL
ncbi:MAG: hypothetical protein PHT69_14495 [Bacteroidales bacterium]|nr:hypothetical protein [Bacteroidales bacterium]